MALQFSLDTLNSPILNDNERFVFRQSHISADIKHADSNGPRYHASSSDGDLFLTQFRMIYVPKKMNGEFRGISMKLTDFAGTEKFHQPIFGCTNVTGCVQNEVDGGLPCACKFKFSFKRDGANGFMSVFIPLMGVVRERLINGGNRREASPNPAPSAPAFDHQNAAFYDPHNPTRVYVQAAHTAGHAASHLSPGGMGI